MGQDRRKDTQPPVIGSYMVRVVIRGENPGTMDPGPTNQQLEDQIKPAVERLAPGREVAVSSMRTDR